MFRLAPALALLPLALAASDSCPPSGAAHIIVARASGEPPGYGIIGNLSSSVVSMLPGSTQEALDYPASFDDYFPSEADGVAAMKDAISQFVQACPDSALVCMGYSQGAQVVADALVGTDDQFMPSNINSTVNGSLPTATLQQVAAVILMGDPSHTTDQPFDVGNSTHDGFFPRENNDLISKYGLDDKIQSYCDANDRYCDSGNSSIVHAGYVQEYGTVAAKFVVDKVKAFGGSNSTSSSGSGSATSTGAAASGTGAASNMTVTMGSPTATSGYSTGSSSGSGSSSATGAASSQPSTGGAEALRSGAGAWTAAVGLVMAFSAALAL